MRLSVGGDADIGDAGFCEGDAVAPRLDVSELLDERIVWRDGKQHQAEAIHKLFDVEVGVEVALGW